MAEQARPHHTPRALTSDRGVGVAVHAARGRFAWLWSRESLLRLALSLVLATALWLYVTDKQNPQFVDLGQPISVSEINMSKGLTVVNQLPDVQIRYRTDNPNQYVPATSFTASVNLLHRGRGTWPRVPVTVASTDPVVKDIRVTPASVPVVIDNSISKVVRVETAYAGKSATSPASGYTAGPPNIQPDSVTIEGAESIVNQVDHAEVQINLSGQKTSLLAFYPVTLVDSAGAPVAKASTLNVTPSATVQVSVPIKALASFKSLPLLVTLRGHPRSGVGVSGLSVNPPLITARGLPAVLTKVTKLYTAPVWLSGQKAGTLSRKVRVPLPRGITSDITTVTVKVQLQPVDSGISVDVPVSPINVTPGLVVHVRPGSVLATLTGPSARVRSASSHLSGVINLYNYAPGVYQLTPAITPPKGFVVQSTYPTTVTVIVQSAAAVSR